MPDIPLPTVAQTHEAPDPKLPTTAEDLPWLAALNPQQRLAVTTTQGAVLMLAGAGTGKTRALTSRLAYLLQSGRARPQEILTVTFTNKAANEMRERVEQIVGYSAAGWWLGTFHTLCARLLRRHAELIERSPRFTILDAADQTRVLRLLMDEAGQDTKRWPPRQGMTEIQGWKDRGFLPDQVPASSRGEFAGGQLVELYQRYQDRLTTINALDFGDLLLLCLTLLRQHEDIAAHYQQQFRYIMVDEYQDTNRVQYQWLKTLAAQHGNLACVGDDDQAIYGWRGADLSNILDFEQDFPQAKTIRLEENYRSTGHILAAANGLIDHNRNRLGKTLFSTSGLGEAVQVSIHHHYLDEARAIAGQMEGLQQLGLRLTEMAVLTRSSATLRSIEEQLMERGLPYVIYGGSRFYERKEIGVALGYLRLIAQPNDDLAFERVVNVPARGIGNTTLIQLRQAAREHRLSLYQSVERLLRGEIDLPSRSAKSLVGFFRQVESWRGRSATHPHPELMEQILEESGYIDFWQAQRTPDAPGRIESLHELTNAMAEFETLDTFLEHVSLVLDSYQESREDAVRLSTIHAAKGLEFDAVFLPAWEEGAFPSQMTQNERGHEGLEEERRLAYVAMTRARQRLFISAANTRLVHGKMMDALPSRFLDELPAANTLWSEPSGFSGLGSSGGWTAPIIDADPLPTREPPDSPGWRRLMARRQEGSAPVFRQAPPAETFHVGERVFHEKFGYGQIEAVDGSKLRILFDKAGEKRVLDSYLKRAK